MANKRRNPFFRALWKHCRAKPFAVEDHPWGDTVFKVGSRRGKIFAFLGHPDSNQAGATVKPTREELDLLLGSAFIQLAPYIGRYGWIHLSVRDQNGLRLALDLIDENYERIVSSLKRRGATAAGASLKTIAPRGGRAGGPGRSGGETSWTPSSVRSVLIR